MNNFNDMLKKYAKLAVKTGVNIQENQTLIINAPLCAVDFVREIVTEAYSAGALHVHVDWYDEQLALIEYKNAKDEAFDYYPTCLAKARESFAENDAAFLSISASDPDLLKGIDPKLVSRNNTAAGIKLKRFMELMQQKKVHWSIISIPTDKWAKKVFPNLDTEDAVDELWKKIFTVTRVDTDDPVKSWAEHDSLIKSKCKLFNSKQYKFLHLKSSKTDLKIELPKKHIWLGGSLSDYSNNSFVPNMPTEEIFTAPLKTGVNGIVHSTKPLNYGGSIIDNFSITFENGKVVDFSAEEGYEILKNLIETDEGSHYIGEVALVPNDSPISNTNLIFYRTLFDENASCHLALGTAYASCLEGGVEMNDDQLNEHGLNTSITHVDFMIGSPDFNVTGITESGEHEPIFINGEWC